MVCVGREGGPLICGLPYIHQETFLGWDSVSDSTKRCLLIIFKFEPFYGVHMRNIMIKS